MHAHTHTHTHTFQKHSGPRKCHILCVCCISYDFNVSTHGNNYSLHMLLELASLLRHTQGTSTQMAHISPFRVGATTHSSICWPRSRNNSYCLVVYTGKKQYYIFHIILFCTSLKIKNNIDVNYIKTCNAIPGWHYTCILDIQDESHNGTASGLQVIKWQCAGMAFTAVHVGKVLYMYNTQQGQVIHTFGTGRFQQKSC